MLKITHSFFAGLGGHTSVFWAQQKYASKYNLKLSVGLYGIEKPLTETIENLNLNNIQYFYEKKNSKWDVFHPIRLAFKLRESKGNIVFLHGNYGVFFIYVICVLFGRSKLVLRETQALNLKTIRQKINSIFAAVFANQVVFLSENYKKTFLSKFNLITRYFPNKFHVIPNGLNTDLFSNNCSLRENSSTIKIGMISRVVAIKDHITLIHAIKELIDDGFNNIELIIAGDGENLPVIKKEIIDQSLSDNVKLLGLISYSNIPDFLNSLDIYVHSTYGETMSNSIMQAQSCGLPIIGTDVFGVNNVIKHNETGFLFSLGNVNELKIYLKELINDSALRKKFGHHSRTYALENLSDNIMMERYSDLFKKLTINGKEKNSNN